MQLAMDPLRHSKTPLSRTWAAVYCQRKLERNSCTCIAGGWF